MTIVYCVVSFLAGLILMDILWAWKTGLLGHLMNRLRSR